MSIKYTEISSVGITPEAGVNVASLNTSFSKLIENDTLLVPTAGFSPTVWEATWYNNREGLPGYGRGAAVWLNTESIDELVRNRAKDLENYAQSTQVVKHQIEEALANEDAAAYYSILKKFALGEFAGQPSPVYYVGKLTEKVQIRISKISNNKDLPTEDSWEDFFIRYGEGVVQDQILSVFDAVCPTEFQRHMTDYHLSGNEDIRSISDLSNTYLLNDLTNLSDKQKFNSHYWYDNAPLVGFDHVRKFVMKKFDGGKCKWFKIWDSGMVEHGGIVDPTDPDGTGDSSDFRRYTVNLKWAYDGGVAPTYDYPPEGLISFYNNEKYYLNAGMKSDLTNPELGYSFRYTVSLATIDKVRQSPYGTYSGRIYDSADVCFMNNSDFSFVLNGPFEVFVSYCVKGYSIKASRY